MGTGGDATGERVGRACVPRTLGTVASDPGSGAVTRAVLRLVFSPRWLLWHLLTLGAMVTCGFLSVWQWHRAGSALGSALNVGYALQWPAFAVFFGWIWWRMLRMELVKLREAPPAAAPAPRDDTPSPFAYRPGRVRHATDDEDPEMAEYNRMLAALAARDAADQEG